MENVERKKKIKQCEQGYREEKSIARRLKRKEKKQRESTTKKNQYKRS